MPNEPHQHPDDYRDQIIADCAFCFRTVPRDECVEVDDETACPGCAEDRTARIPVQTNAELVWGSR